MLTEAWPENIPPFMANVAVIAALIDTDNKVLLTKQPVGTVWQNYWALPGGRCTGNETMLQSPMSNL